MFQGFCQESIDFLWNIRFNNERSWFNEHKQEYKTLVEQPMRELAKQVYNEFIEQYPDEGLSLHISRIYRDARRLYGRGPYKDHLWFSFRHDSEDWRDAPSLYFEISPETYGFGLVFYPARSYDMEIYRKSITDNPRKLQALAERFRLQDEFVLEGAEYKKPKGDVGELLNPWYNRKFLCLCRDEKCGGTLFKPELADRLLKGFKFLVPYHRYIMKALSSRQN